MKKVMLLLLLFITTGIGLNAEVKMVGLEEFLGKVREEYKKVNSDEIIAKLEYERDTAEDGIKINGIAKKEKYSSNYIRNYSAESFQGQDDGEKAWVEIGKKWRYGTDIKISGSYDNREAKEEEKNSSKYEWNYLNKDKIISEKRVEYGVNVEQSLFREILKVFLSDRNAKNMLDRSINCAVVRENYVLQTALLEYIRYQSYKAEDEKLKIAFEELDKYIGELIAKGINKIKLAAIMRIRNEIESNLDENRKILLRGKYILTSLAGLPFEEVSLEFTTADKEKIFEQYRIMVEKANEIILKNSKLDIEKARLDKESYAAWNSPELTLFGGGKIKHGESEVKYTEIYSDKTTSGGIKSSYNNQNTPDYVIGLRLSMELFDGIADVNAKLGEMLVKNKENNFAVLEREIKEKVKLQMAVEKVLLGEMGKQEQREKETLEILSIQRAYLKELFMENKKEDRDFIENEIIRFVNNYGAYIDATNNVYIKTINYYRNLLSVNKDYR